MTRHSKNNTTAGSFTYAERQKLNYGTQTSRCSKESLRPFTHCHLCLELARDPHSCPQGHLSCRSCSLEDILSQKTDFKLKKLEKEREEKEKEAKRLAEMEEKRIENLKEFLSQQGSAGKLKRSHEESKSNDIIKMISNNSNNTSNTMANTTSTTTTPVTLTTCCRAGTKGPHPISLKSLIPVKFKELEKDQPACPICLKPFNSSSALKAILFPKCGHVTCDPCYNNLKSAARKCLVCEDVMEGDVIKLESEGTGFAAGGGIVETKRYDLAFQ